MLPHYSPLKVAETLQHPQRASTPAGSTSASAARPGTDPLTMLALQRDRRQPAPDDFPQQLDRAARLPRGPRCRADHPFARLAARCRGCRSGPRSGCSAPRRRARSGPAELGLPYCVRRLHQPARRGDRGRSTASASRRSSRPAERRRVAVGVVARLRRDRRGGRAARVERPDGDRAAAPGPADPGARRSSRRCASWSAASRARRGPARRDRLAGDGARGARGGRRASTAPTR